MNIHGKLHDWSTVVKPREGHTHNRPTLIVSFAAYVHVCLFWAAGCVWLLLSVGFSVSVCGHLFSSVSRRQAEALGCDSVIHTRFSQGKPSTKPPDFGIFFFIGADYRDEVSVTHWVCYHASLVIFLYSKVFAAHSVSALTRAPSAGQVSSK